MSYYIWGEREGRGRRGGRAEGSSEHSQPQPGWMCREGGGSRKPTPSTFGKRGRVEGGGGEDRHVVVSGPESSSEVSSLSSTSLLRA